MILYVIDGTEIIDERNPMKDFDVLRDELRLYKNGLLIDKPAIIALNKSDRSYTNYKKRNEMLQAHLTKQGCNFPLIPISAKEGTNLEVLLESLCEIVKQHDQQTEAGLTKE